MSDMLEDEEETKTLYQQSALSRRPREEYFQPLDPCAWREDRLKTRRTIKTTRLWLHWQEEECLIWMLTLQINKNTPQETI